MNIKVRVVGPHPLHSTLGRRLVQILSTLLIRPGQILESVVRSLFTMKACDCKWLFELPAWNNVRKKYTFTDKLLRLNITS